MKSWPTVRLASRTIRCTTPVASSASMPRARTCRTWCTTGCTPSSTAKLAAEAGMLPGVVSSDSDVIAELIARAAAGPGGDLEQALLEVLPKLEGAFSLVLMDHARLIAVRDPNGFRPLCLGRLDG